jgi:hypothetical protein
MWGGKGNLHEVWMLQVLVAAQVVHHCHPRRPYLVSLGWRRLRLHPGRPGTYPGWAGTPSGSPLHSVQWLLRHVRVYQSDELTLQSYQNSETEESEIKQDMNK